MIPISLSELQHILTKQILGSCHLPTEHSDFIFKQVSTDSRQSCLDGIFFALKGNHFDGHQYLASATQQGVKLAIVEVCQPQVLLPQLQVRNVREALGLLAAWVKRQVNPITIAITGSSGKTTLKEMTASILQYFTGQEHVLFTQGNLNNDLGVPLTLLRLTPQHQFAVVELGANHQGEIAYTTHLVNPDVAIINNIALAHLAGFGSLQGVSKAKSEIYLGLKEQGIAVINLDNHDLARWQSNIAQHKISSFSLQNRDADFYATEIQLTETGSEFLLHTPQGEIWIRSSYLGEHNVSNALAAATLSYHVGVSLPYIKAGLEISHQVKGRLFRIEPCSNLVLLDDTYNANVESLKSAIAVLAQSSSFRILVVGDMAELGTESQFCHEQVARVAKEAHLQLVLSLGAESEVISRATHGVHFTDKVALQAYLQHVIEQQLNTNQPVVVLAKGSRRMQMETVIQSLQDRFSC